MKATALKDKLGLGYKPAHIRSKSTSAAAPVVVKKKDFRDSRRLASHRFVVLPENCALVYMQMYIHSLSCEDQASGFTLTINQLNFAAIKFCILATLG